jgi:hypothetical protein
MQISKLMEFHRIRFVSVDGTDSALRSHTRALIYSIVIFYYRIQNKQFHLINARQVIGLLANE